jgi:hypothetical protein
MRRNSGNLRSLKCSRAPERPPGHSVGALGATGHSHDREVRSAGGYHPTLSGFPDLRRRGCGSRPGMVLRCPSYSQAVKWARLECKSYNIPEPATDFPVNEESGDVPPFFASSARNLRRSADLKEKGK